jgi:predicted RNase H-like HicB family nuclease
MSEGFTASRGDSRATTYLFPVKLEEDEDGRWIATCPSLSGCETWGATKQIALRNLHELLEIRVADALDAGQHLPVGTKVLDDTVLTTMNGIQGECNVAARTRPRGRRERPLLDGDGIGLLGRSISARQADRFGCIAARPQARRPSALPTAGGARPPAGAERPGTVGSASPAVTR